MLYGSCIGIFTLVLYLYGAPLDAVLYAALLVGALFAFVGAASLFDQTRKTKALKQVLAALPQEWEQLGEKESVPKPDTDSERLCMEKLQTLSARQMQMESKMRISRQEMLDYYSLWVHQIKTPMAAMQVLIQSLEESMLREETQEKPEQTQILRDMKLELFQAEQYVEMVLSYLRAEEMGHDLLLKEYALDSIIKQAVKKYSPMFIAKRIRLVYQSLADNVVTDEKWMVFVIEQLLSNALKYTSPGGTIEIFRESGGKRRLVIKDNGIGIQAEDLPRIFEKGFTGFNGRQDKKSTGIGLYLCRMICDKLGVMLTVESGEGSGTRVYLGIEKKRIRY